MHTIKLNVLQVNLKMKILKYIKTCNAEEERQDAKHA